MTSMSEMQKTKVAENLKLLTYLWANIPIAGMHCGEFSLVLIDIGQRKVGFIKPPDGL